MSGSSDDHKFSEVRVERHQDSPFLMRHEEDLLVPGVLLPVTGPQDPRSRRAPTARGHRPRYRHREGASSAGGLEQGLDSLVADQAMGVDQAGLNVFSFEPGVPFEDGLEGVARGEHAEDVLDREAPAPDDRLATVDSRIDGDSPE